MPPRAPPVLLSFAPKCSAKPDKTFIIVSPLNRLATSSADQPQSIAHIADAADQIFQDRGNRRLGCIGEVRFAVDPIPVDLRREGGLKLLYLAAKGDPIAGVRPIFNMETLGFKPGHNGVIVVWAGPKRIEELSAGGAIIGMFPSLRYEEAVVELHSGDVLLAFSDGVPEAHDPAEEEFGEDRLKELLRRTAHLTVNEISSTIMEDLRMWMVDADQYDDLTFIIVKVQ